MVEGRSQLVPEDAGEIVSTGYDLGQVEVGAAGPNAGEVVAETSVSGQSDALPRCVFAAVGRCHVEAEIADVEVALKRAGQADETAVGRNGVIEEPRQVENFEVG